MSFAKIVDGYVAEFQRHYPQVPITCRVKKRNDQLYLHLSIRGDPQEPMDQNTLIGAIADFQRKGRQQPIHHFRG